MKIKNHLVAAFFATLGLSGVSLYAYADTPSCDNPTYAFSIDNSLDNYQSLNAQFVNIYQNTGTSVKPVDINTGKLGGIKGWYQCSFLTNTKTGFMTFKNEPVIHLPFGLTPTGSSYSDSKTDDGFGVLFTDSNFLHAMTVYVGGEKNTNLSVGQMLGDHSIYFTEQLNKVKDNVANYEINAYHLWGQSSDHPKFTNDNTIQLPDRNKISIKLIAETTNRMNNTTTYLYQETVTPFTITVDEDNPYAIYGGAGNQIQPPADFNGTLQSQYSVSLDPIVVALTGNGQNGAFKFAGQITPPLAVSYQYGGTQSNPTITYTTNSYSFDFVVKQPTNASNQYLGVENEISVNNAIGPKPGSNNLIVNTSLPKAGNAGNPLNLSQEDITSLQNLKATKDDPLSIKMIIQNDPNGKLILPIYNNGLNQKAFHVELALTNQSNTCNGIIGQSTPLPSTCKSQNFKDEIKNLTWLYHYIYFIPSATSSLADTLTNLQPVDDSGHPNFSLDNLYLDITPYPGNYADKNMQQNGYYYLSGYDLGLSSEHINSFVASLNIRYSDTQNLYVTSPAIGFSIMSLKNTLRSSQFTYSDADALSNGILQSEPYSATVPEINYTTADNASIYGGQSSALGGNAIVYSPWACFYDTQTSDCTDEVKSYPRLVIKNVYEPIIYSEGFGVSDSSLPQSYQLIGESNVKAMMNNTMYLTRDSIYRHDVQNLPSGAIRAPIINIVATFVDTKGVAYSLPSFTYPDDNSNLKQRSKLKKVQR
ncbi:hypothetical protein [Cysteiniphilum halobium]|uniref:hypothetical protein n=1 Tax=Cysteiniphilum halobium TaxID=2219059 RepID=UPI003F859ACB